MMPDDLVEGVHYYMENGFMVFTAVYLRQRGYCCESGCRIARMDSRRCSRSGRRRNRDRIDVSACTGSAAFRESIATLYRFATLDGSHTRTSPEGAKQLSPALQRWVEWEMEPSPVGTAEVGDMPAPETRNGAGVSRMLENCAVPEGTRIYFPLTQHSAFGSVLG